MKEKEEFKWNTPTEKLGKFDGEVKSGDIRIVNIPVKVLFEYSDKIVADFDSETNTVLEYKSGYLMKVFNDQTIVYKGEESVFLAHAQEIIDDYLYDGVKCKIHVSDELEGVDSLQDKFNSVVPKLDTKIKKPKIIVPYKSEEMQKFFDEELYDVFKVNGVDHAFTWKNIRCIGIIGSNEKIISMAIHPVFINTDIGAGMGMSILKEFKKE